MAVDDNPGDTNEVSADNVIPFDRVQAFKFARASDGSSHDDDELLQRATDMIAKCQTASVVPGLTQVQELFHELICAGASPMARDKIVDAIIAAFGMALGGKRALVATWNQLVKQHVADCAPAARDKSG